MDKMPAYRWSDAIRLAAFLKGIGPQIAEALEPEMTAVLEEGEELPDVAHLLDVLGRMVVAEESKYDQADYEKHRHGANAASARFDLRRQAMPLLRSRVQEVRKWLRSHLGTEKVKRLLGFSGRTPRSDQGLEDLATVMVRRLAELEPLRTPAGKVDPAGWADYLRQDRLDLLPPGRHREDRPPPGLPGRAAGGQDPEAAGAGQRRLSGVDAGTADVGQDLAGRSKKVGQLRQLR